MKSSSGEFTAEDPVVLPREYGRDRLVLMVVNPRRLFAWWEMTRETWEEVWRRAGSPREYRTVLRLLSSVAAGVSDGEPGREPGEQPGGEERLRFEVELETDTRSMYLDAPEGGRPYVLELGLRLPDGGYHRLLRSEVVTTPSEGASDDETVSWGSLAPDARPGAPDGASHAPGNPSSTGGRPASEEDS